MHIEHRFSSALSPLRKAEGEHSEGADTSHSTNRACSVFKGRNSISTEMKFS